MDIAPDLQPPDQDRPASRGRSPSPIHLDGDDARRHPAAMPRSKRRRLAFGWHGGKFSHLDWLLPLLPEAHHYGEPFAGSAAVLLNRDPSPVETCNDIDGEVTNFFRVLRDQNEALERAAALTPFSREEFHRAVVGSASDATDLERARRFYVKARQTRTGLAQTAALGRWADCKDTGRAGMSGVVSRWLGGMEALPEIAARLLRVQIENRPAADMVRPYDGPQTLFYCDPPYLHATRGDAKAYGFEMDEGEHRALAAVADGGQGMVAVSGYDHPLMDELFAPGRRRKILGPDKVNHSTKGTRQEVLRTSVALKAAPDLFG